MALVQLCLTLDDALEMVVPCASRCLGDVGECPTIPPNPCNYVQLGSRQLGMDDGRVSSTSDRSLCGKMKASRSRLSPTEHPVDELSELEFRAHFYIPNSVSIQLIGRETSSTDGISQNMIYFANEQFAASILNMLYQLDLFLLEIIFVYTIKMSPKERFSLSTHTPSL
ncbi:hypothetical protein CK203_054764 [Vitis vinifera]|uniref:Uncharacterized protein n=1 Tax=Vitis vinifera TaxID=29760 RepID=A0A438GIR4_VITVI|nr:hypothetical protein CK203_054764 [Vitis vinifera]